MSITAAELIAFASANLPTDDVSTTGGAIDATRRPVFTDITVNSSVDIVSDGADTRNVTIRGRNAAGTILTEVLTLNGNTPVLGSNTYERVLSVNAASSSGTRTVTVTQHSNAATMGTIPVNEVGFYYMFQNASSSVGGTSDRYEKFFFKNTDGALSLLSAQVTLTASPGADANHIITMGLATAVNDSGSVANRLAAPGGVSFVGLSSAQSVPGTDLAAAAAIGVWIHQQLLINASALKSTFTTQLAGSSV